MSLPNPEDRPDKPDKPTEIRSVRSDESQPPRQPDMRVIETDRHSELIATEKALIATEKEVIAVNRELIQNIQEVKNQIQELTGTIKNLTDSLKSTFGRVTLRRIRPKEGMPEVEVKEVEITKPAEGAPAPPPPPPPSPRIAAEDLRQRIHARVAKIQRRHDIEAAKTKATETVEPISEEAKKIAEALKKRFEEFRFTFSRIKPSEMELILSLIPEQFREQFKTALEHANLIEIANVLAQVPENVRKKVIDELEYLAARTRSISAQFSKISNDIKNTTERFAVASAYAIPIVGHALILINVAKGLITELVGTYRALLNLRRAIQHFVLTLRVLPRHLSETLRQRLRPVGEFFSKRVLPIFAPVLEPVKRILGEVRNVLARRILGVLTENFKLTKNVLPRLPGFLGMLIGMLAKGIGISAISNAVAGALGAKIGAAAGAAGGAAAGGAAGTAGAAAGGALLAVGKVALAVAGALVIAGKIGEALGVTSDKIRAAAQVIEREGGQLSAGLAKAAADLWDWGDELKASLPPVIGDLAQGFAHGVALIMTGVARFTGWIEGGIRWLADTANKIGGVVMDTVKETAKHIAENGGVISSAFANASLTLIDMGDKLRSQLPPIIGDLVGGLFYYTAMLTQGIASVAYIFEQAGSFIMNAVRNIFEGIRRFFGSIIDRISGALGTVGDWLRNAFSGITSAISGAVKSVNQFASAMLGTTTTAGLPPGLVGGTTDLNSLIRQMMSAITQSISSGSSKQADILRDAIASGFRNVRLTINVDVKDKEVRVNTNYG